jgi:hypothetical protein
MRLYLDDDSAAKLLVHLLRRAGHDVETPVDVGLVGEADAVHLRHAIHEQRVCLSGNYQHFEDLHQLALEAQGHHPGIFVVRKDNDPKRDMKGPGVVRAITNFLAAGIPPADQNVILNQWR